MTRRGFTLLEVLLSLALIAMLSAGVMGFLWDLLGRRDDLNRTLVDTQAGAALLERMESDILCGLAGDQGAAGVKGSSTSLVLLTRGVALPVEGESAAGDLQGSEYVFEGRALKARRWAGDAAPTGTLESVSPHVQAVRFSYFDGSAWKGSFDSAAADGLPVAIEIALWFGDAAPAESSDGSPRAGPPRREPDRLRVIVVPDGPVAPWKEAR